MVLISSPAFSDFIFSYFSDTLSDGSNSIPNYIETTPPPDMGVQTEPTRCLRRRDPPSTETFENTRPGALPLDPYLRFESDSSDEEMEEDVLSNLSTTPAIPSTPSTAPTTPSHPPMAATTSTASPRVRKPVPILCPWGSCPQYVVGIDYKPLRDHIMSEHVKRATGNQLKCQWPGCDKMINLPRGVGGHMVMHYREL